MLKKTNTIILLTILFLLSTRILSQEFRIAGQTNIYSEISKLKLYKYNSIFEQTLIVEIPVENNFFSFKNELNEPDVFMLQNPLNSQFILFIWDDNLEFRIDKDNFYKSEIRNSKLSSEFKSINDSLSLIGAKYRLLDSLLSNKNLNEKFLTIEKDSLLLQRSFEYDKAFSGIKQLKENYIKKNPNSFISLFFLTSTGFENTDTNKIQLFYCLSERLKKHTRADIFLNTK